MSLLLFKVIICSQHNTPASALLGGFPCMKGVKWGSEVTLKVATAIEIPQQQSCRRRPYRDARVHLMELVLLRAKGLLTQKDI